MIARGAFEIMVARAAFVLSGYAIHVSMAHLLTPADYGTLGVVLGLVTLWRVCLSTGVPQTTTRFIAAEPRRSRDIWRRALNVQMTAALGLWALYVAGTPLWVALLNDASLGPYLLLSSLMIPLMAWYQVNLAYYTGRLQFRFQAMVMGLYAAVRVPLALGLVMAGLRIHGVVLGLTLGALAAGLVSHRRIAADPEAGGTVPGWREMAAFSLPLVAVSFGISALLNLDLLLLQRFFPESELVGYYNGAVNLGKAPYWVLSAFATTALPSIARAIGAGDREAAARLVQRHVTYVLFISLPAAALIVPSAAPVLALVYPAEFSQASGPLALLVCSGSALALLAVLTSAITAAGRPQVAMGVVLGCTLLQVAAGVVLVPRFAMTGAAATNLVTVSAGVAAAAWIVHARFGGWLEPGRVAKALALSGALAAAVWLAQGVAVWILPLVYLAGLLLYGWALMMTGAVAPGELQAIRRILRRAAPAQGDAAPPP